MFPRLWLANPWDFIAWRPSWRNLQQFIEQDLPQNLRNNILD
jgi:hypothetical protein